MAMNGYSILSQISKTRASPSDPALSSYPGQTAICETWISITCCILIFKRAINPGNSRTRCSSCVNRVITVKQTKRGCTQLTWVDNPNACALGNYTYARTQGHGQSLSTSWTLNQVGAEASLGAIQWGTVLSVNKNVG